jgi:hypothetical protein
MHGKREFQAITKEANIGDDKGKKKEPGRTRLLSVQA